MKNIFMTLFLFIGVILICFFSVRYLNNISDKVYAENTSIKKYIQSENWTKANSKSKEMSNQWHIYSNNCSVFVNHTLIDDLSLEEHKLEAYIKTKDKEEALASSESIEFLLERIKKLETINLQNLF
ncbi:protein of unknown function [Clostridium acidisoli DSM 12555]|uniref:DUF4363 domain-containing protein n=1 Tax=Clostridium acidisoli DSM 12555 TaxID=1121291 RepID=A0A1W1XIG7_9CLOT|nr:DUF4363 family protein [Clostridium acidisoli]SMC23780.1 protein of unknown function [Clostridium acidisoli DSM 12555]